jgi:hypothetical protein
MIMKRNYVESLALPVGFARLEYLLVSNYPTVKKVRRTPRSRRLVGRLLRDSKINWRLKSDGHAKHPGAPYQSRKVVDEEIARGSIDNSETFERLFVQNFKSTCKSQVD